MTNRRFEVKSFTNDLDQVLNPGDEVIYIGTAYKSTKINKGVFDGVYVEDRRTYDLATKTYSDPIETVIAVRVGNVPDKRFIWNWETRDGKYEAILRKAVLPKLRVYKLNDTKLENLVGKSF